MQHTVSIVSNAKRVNTKVTLSAYPAKDNKQLHSRTAKNVYTIPIPKKKDSLNRPTITKQQEKHPGDNSTKRHQAQSASTFFERWHKKGKKIPFKHSYIRCPHHQHRPSTNGCERSSYCPRHTYLLPLHHPRQVSFTAALSFWCAIFTIKSRCWYPEQSVMMTLRDTHRGRTRCKPPFRPVCLCVWEVCEKGRQNLIHTAKECWMKKDPFRLYFFTPFLHSVRDFPFDSKLALSLFLSLSVSLSRVPLFLSATEIDSEMQPFCCAPSWPLCSERCMNYR